MHIWGPPSPVHSLEERIARSFSPPLFPVDLGDIPAEVRFHDVPDGTWELDGIRILAHPVSHPGSTVGFRLEHDGSSLAFIPDHEPVLGVDLAELEPDWISGHAVADGVDVTPARQPVLRDRIRRPRRLGTLERRRRRGLRAESGRPSPRALPPRPRPQRRGRRPAGTAGSRAVERERRTASGRRVRRDDDRAPLARANVSVRRASC